MSADTGSTAAAGEPQPASGPAAGRQTLLIVAAWTWVAIPFLYGVYQLTTRIPALF